MKSPTDVSKQLLQLNSVYKWAEEMIADRDTRIGQLRETIATLENRLLLAQQDARCLDWIERQKCVYLHWDRRCFRVEVYDRAALDFTEAGQGRNLREAWKAIPEEVKPKYVSGHESPIKPKSAFGREAPIQDARG